jgi:hypothetical protein
MYNKLYGREKRRSKRISYICEIECEGDGASRLNSRINDLSESGVFIDSMTCFAVGSVLTMKFRVGDIVIETMGEVRYSMPHVGMGVRFLDLKPEHRAAIEALVTGSGPLPSPAPESDRPEALVENLLSGSFMIVNVVDIIQMIDNSRLTGKLIIKSPAASGEIYFNAGQLAGASMGRETGLDALNRFLEVTDGTFEFKISPREFKRTIRAASNTSLLVNLLRGRNEEVRPVA